MDTQYDKKTVAKIKRIIRRMRASYVVFFKVEKSDRRLARWNEGITFANRLLEAIDLDLK